MPELRVLLERELLRLARQSETASLAVAACAYPLAKVRFLIIDFETRSFFSVQSILLNLLKFVRASH